MMILTRNVKESIKTALAMTIVYGFALWMGWDKPYWAALCVAFISLATTGMSLNKGVKRLLGTLVAFPVSLLVIALFAQDRWWFIAAISVWVGLCTYKYVSTRSYFWFVAGFVSTIICFDAGVDPVNAFNIAVLRVEETGMGILVYSLISTFLWPISTFKELNRATIDLMEIQQKLFSQYLMVAQNSADGSISADGSLPADGSIAIRMQEIQIRNRFDQAFISARTDSYDVKELSNQWQCFQNQSLDLMVSLDRWYLSLKEVSQLDLNHLLPNLNVLNHELELRFSQIEQMLSGHAPKCQPIIIDLSYNKEAVKTLSHFHQAAFTVTRIQLRHIEQLTRDLFATISALKGFGEHVPELIKKPLPWSGLLPEPEPLMAAIKVITIQFVAYLIWIYIEVPGGTAFVSMIAAIEMSVVMMPQIPVLSLLPAFIISGIFGGLMHLFIMPHLSGFSGLGSMIFLVTFVLCYLFSTPARALMRLASLAMFVAMIGVSNQQVYSFLSVANTLVLYAIIFILFALMANFPVSVQPEKAFIRLIRQFFYSCEYQMTMMNKHPMKASTLLNRWKESFHLKQLTNTPAQLLIWGKAVNKSSFSQTSASQVQVLTIQLYVLTFRIQELLDINHKPPNNILFQPLLTDIHLWHENLQKIFKDLSHASHDQSAKILSQKLQTTIEQLEDTMEDIINKNTKNDLLSESDSEHFYLLLATYRSLSETIIQYTELAEKIDWKRWKEPVFS